MRLKGMAIFAFRLDYFTMGERKPKPGDLFQREEFTFSKKLISVVKFRNIDAFLSFSDLKSSIVSCATRTPMLAIASLVFTYFIKVKIVKNIFNWCLVKWIN